MNGSPRAPQWRWLKLLHSPDADRNLLGGQGCDRVTLQAALVPVVADFSSSSAARARSLRSIPLTVAAMVMTRTRLSILERKTRRRRRMSSSSRTSCWGAREISKHFYGALLEIRLLNDEDDDDDNNRIEKQVHPELLT